MTYLDSLRARISLQTFIIVAALIIAPSSGIAIAAALRGDPLLLIIVGALLGAVIMVYAPIELLLLAGILGTMLADSRLVASGVIYYTRFVPMGMLTVRTLLDVVLHRERHMRLERQILVPGMAFIGLAFVSALYSLTRDLTIQRAFSMVFVILAFGLGLPNYLADYLRFSRALKWVIVLIGGVVVVGTLMAGGSQDALYVDQSFLRVRGIFINPNTQGLMAMLIFYPLIWWWQTERHPLRRRILVAGVIIWGLLVLLAGSRASFAGLLGGGIVLALMYGRSSLRYASLIAIALALALLFIVYTPEYGRVIDFYTPTDAPTPVEAGIAANVDRPYLIQRAIELGMRSPILGVGFGASDRLFAEDVPFLVAQGIYVAGSHNSYTRMFVDLGLVGLAFGFTVFAVVLHSIFTAPANIRRDSTIALLTATVIAGLINAFFEDWLFGFGSASTLPFWFFFALIPIRLTQLAMQPKLDMKSMDTAAEAVK